MSNDLSSSRCVCGEPARPIDPGRERWAAWAGYGGLRALRWHQDDASARAGVQEGLLDHRPRPGHTYPVALGHGFVEPAGRSFWTLYETPLAIYNGYGDHGLEGRLCDLALVQCRVDAMQSTGPDRAAGRATVQRVVRVADLLTLPPVLPTAGDDPWVDFFAVGPLPPAVRQGALVRVDADNEGDFGAWALLHDTPQATDLLMLSQWGAHADGVWAGRLRVRDGGRILCPGARGAAVCAAIVPA